jgi:hypothetical protein
VTVPLEIVPILVLVLGLFLCAFGEVESGGRLELEAWKKRRPEPPLEGGSYRAPPKANP